MRIPATAPDRDGTATSTTAEATRTGPAGRMPIREEPLTPPAEAFTTSSLFNPAQSVTGCWAIVEVSTPSQNVCHEDEHGRFGRAEVDCQLSKSTCCGRSVRS